MAARRRASRWRRLGVVMVASSSIAIADGQHVGPFYFLVRHLRVPGGRHRRWRVADAHRAQVARAARPACCCWRASCCCCWCSCRASASSVNGARRWINLGISRFQAVEAVKLLYIVWLASYLVRFRDEVNATWSAMLKPLGVAVRWSALLLAAAGLRFAALLLAITAGMAGAGRRATCRACSAPVADRPAAARDGSRSPSLIACARLTSFLDPWADPFNDGYQLTQRADGGRPRRMVRRRPGRIGAEAVLPARSAHRLHPRGDRRGTRFRRRLRW